MQRLLSRALAVVFIAFALACAGLQGEPVPADKADMVGIWKGVGVDLTITPDGGLDYERTGGAGSRAIQAPIQTWGDKWFEAGIGPMKARFDIDAMPHDSDGETVMTIDGVEVRKVM